MLFGYTAGNSGDVSARLLAQENGLKASART
jgi:hypothetical protein